MTRPPARLFTQTRRPLSSGLAATAASSTRRVTGRYDAPGGTEVDRRYLRGYVLRADDDGDGDGGEGKPLTIVAATEGRKADGLNLVMDTGDLARFQANPVVGYGHSYWGRDGLPIGRADQTWIDGDKLKMDITFDPEDDFAQTVERKYRGGFLNAFSIGFDVWGIDDSGTPEGWELFEVSAVPLPMDPNALVESGRAADEALVRALAEARAGKVLSKANKKLVSNAVTALQALLDAAGGADDINDDEDDEGRKAPTGLSAGDARELERLRLYEAAQRAKEARLLRLAGIKSR
jgi:hypothetical protein